jgi:hypothetical protein
MIEHPEYISKTAAAAWRGVVAYSFQGGKASGYSVADILTL